MAFRWIGFAALALWLALAGNASAQTGAAAACPPLLQHSFNRLQDDKPQSLCQYVGKVLLVVNTASYCGFTPQYEGLEALHARYAAAGLVVMGFPSNDFMGQEPGTEAQIEEFCRLTYGVQFPMFEKTTVKGDDANAFYVALAEASGTFPTWNFHKYLIGRDGQFITEFSPRTQPDDDSVVAALQAALTLDAPE